MSLYAIDMEMQAVLDAMLEGGVDSPEAAEALNQHLEGLDSALEAKAEQYACLIRELEMRSEARAKEASRIRALATVDSNLATRLKERLKEVMERTGKTRIETGLFRLSVAANGGKQPMTIEPEAVAGLPKDLTILTVEPDKERIRAALESGLILPGCTLLPRGTSLRIK
jgi:hypothetical protein